MKVFPRTPQEHFEHQGKSIDTAGRQPDVVDKDTLQQLEDLLKSPDIDKKKLSKELDAQVSDFLSRHQSKLEDIRKIFEANETKFTPEQKQQLEKLLKLAKVDESLKDEQRELSLAIDLTKENLWWLEQGVAFWLTNKINEYFAQWKYQKALDGAVRLSQIKGSEVAAFEMIRRILEKTPSWESLYIKDKKISSSKRSEWIKKMKDNAEDAVREFKQEYYKDARLTETSSWELDEKRKAKKDVSEKKAMKEYDKELWKILNKLNPGSAFKFMELNFEKIAWKPEQMINEKFLLENGYIPKSWKTDHIPDSEIAAMKKLYYYRLNATDKQRKAYNSIAEAKESWLTMNEVNKAKYVLDDIKSKIDNWEIKEGNYVNVLKVLFWDTDWDWKVRNISALNGRVREWVDQWTVFGGQIAKMFENAIGRNFPVIYNIESVISRLQWFENFKINPKTLKWAIDAFIKNPAALVAFRKKLLSEPDRWMNMFYYGKEYGKYKVEELKANEARRESAEASAKSALEKHPEVAKELDKKLIEQQKKDIATAKANLDQIINSKAFKWLDKKDQDSLMKQRAALSDANIQKMLDSQEMKDYRKTIMLSWLTAVFSATDFEWDKQYSAGLVWNLTSEKLNDAIAKSKVFNNLSAPVGIYKAKDWKFSLWIWLTLSWNQDLSKNTTLFYSAGVSGQVLEPQWIWTSAVVGIDWQTNNPWNRLWNAKAAQHLGLVSAYGYGFSLTDPHFDVQWISLQAYWRKDKLEWVEQQAEAIKDSMKTILKQILKPESWKEKAGVTIDSIVAQLRKTFEDTKWEDLYSIAVGIMNTYNSYKDYLKKQWKEGENEAVLNALSEDLAKYMAQNSRNQNIERIVKEWLHLSQVGVWVSFTLSSLLKGFFLSWSLVFTKYDKEHYVENKQVLEEAIKWLNRQEFFEKISTWSLSWKLATINRLLGQWEVVRYNTGYIDRTHGEQPASITVDTAIFKPGMTVFCNPKLAPYIHYGKNGKLMLPSNADISLGKILHQGKEDRILILGGKSAAWCKEIQLWEDKKLKWKDWNWADFNKPWQEYGLDKYNLITEVVSENADIKLDWRANEQLIKYLADNWDVLVNFRQQTAKYRQFINFMKTHSERDQAAVSWAVALLPDSIKSILKEWKADDIRFVYAALSRVSQTRDKQLEGKSLEDKANEYLWKIRLSPENKATIEKYIWEVKKWNVLNDTDWQNMKNILWIRWNDWHRAFADTPNEKLFHILTPVKKLAEMRTSSYEGKIKSEYAGSLTWAESLIAARNKSIAQLEWKATANAGVDEKWKVKLHKWVWAVAWYDLSDQIDDKFVSWPKIIEWSEVKIEDKDNIVARHFLEELFASDRTQFDYIRESIINELKQWGESDKRLAENLGKYEQTPEGIREFIDEILKAKSVDKDWKPTNEPKIKIEMNYWFFAECVNETILLESIKVNVLKTKQKPAWNDVYYYDAIVTNDAVTRARHFGYVGVVGKQKLKQDGIPEKEKDPGKTDPEPTEKWNTVPKVDLEGLDADNIKIVDWWQAIEIDGVTYNFVELEDTNAKILAAPDGKFYMLTEDVNWGIYRELLDVETWKIIPNSAVTVVAPQAVVAEDVPAVIPAEQSEIKVDPRELAAHANAALWGHYQSTDAVTKTGK